MYWGSRCRFVSFCLDISSEQSHFMKLEPVGQLLLHGRIKRNPTRARGNRRSGSGKHQLGSEKQLILTANGFVGFSDCLSVGVVSFLNWIALCRRFVEIGRKNFFPDSFFRCVFNLIPFAQRYPPHWGDTARSVCLPVLGRERKREIKIKLDDCFSWF